MDGLLKFCWGSAVKVYCKFCSYSQSIRLHRSQTKFATLCFLSVLFRSHIDPSLNSFAMEESVDLLEEASKENERTLANLSPAEEATSNLDEVETEKFLQ